MNHFDVNCESLTGTIGKTGTTFKNKEGWRKGWKVRITPARVAPLKIHQPAVCPPSAVHTKQIASKANVGSSGVFLLFDCNQQSLPQWSGITAAFHLSRLVQLWKWIKPGWWSGRDSGDTVAHSATQSGQLVVSGSYLMNKQSSTNIQY